jgi:hypothetical protein
MAKSQDYKCHLKRLKILRRLKNNRKKWNSYINNADKPTLDTVSLSVQNFLKGNVPMKKSHLKGLKRYRGVLRKIAGKRTSLKKRKQFTVQSGGFLPLILSAAIPVISALIRHFT